MSNIPETLAIRRMTADDIGWAMRLAEGSPQAPHWSEPAWLSAVNPGSEPKRIALAAETPRDVPHLGRIAPKVGLAVASLAPPEAELEAIVVAPALRRQGLGAELLRAMAAELETAGVAEVTLEVRASNRPALAFYRSMGYAEWGRRTGYYIDPVEDAVLMRVRLGGSR